jgi:MarR family transcriptional regulator, organic hydroperoxide resistance regulator
MQSTLTKWSAPAPALDIDVDRARRKETIRGALKLFRVTLDAVRRHAEWVESRHGIDGAQLWAVWELAQAPGLRAVDLAKAMAVHRATADALLDELVKRGLVLAQTAGGHVQTFSLSAAGRRLADAAPDYGQGVLKSALERLPDASLGQLVASLRAVSESLPFREEAAAMQPMSNLLRPTRTEAEPPACDPAPPARNDAGH